MFNRQIKSALLVATILTAAAGFILPANAQVVINGNETTTQSILNGQSFTVTSTGNVTITGNDRAVNGFGLVFPFFQNDGSLSTSGNGNTVNLGSTTVDDIINNGSISGNFPNDATFYMDNVTSDSFLNVGTISGNNSGILINDGLIAENNAASIAFENTGSISSTNDTAIMMDNDASIANTLGTAFSNSGTISGPNNGILMRNGADIQGAFSNSGQISGDLAFRMQDFGTLLFNDFINSGIISGSGSAIFMSDRAQIGGSIINNGTISSNLFTIFMASNSRIQGGIVNNGTISTSGFASFDVSDAQIDGGITNNAGGVIGGGSVGAIRFKNLTGTTPIFINGGQINGDIIDQQAANGRSPVTIGADFTSNGNMTVSSITTTAGNEFTISAGNVIDVQSFSAGTGTYNFVVNGKQASEFGQVRVAGAPDLSGTSLSVQSSSGIKAGDEILIIDGGAAIIGGPGGTASNITEGLFLFDFDIIDGTGIDTPTDNTDLFLRVSTANTVENSVNTQNENAGRVLDDIIASGTSDQNLQTIISNINASSSAAQVDEIISSISPTINRGNVVASLNASSNVLSLVGQNLNNTRNGTSNSAPSAFHSFMLNANSFNNFVQETGFGSNNNSGIAMDDPLMGLALGYFDALGQNLKHLNMWSQVFSQVASQGQRSGISGYDLGIYGLALGVDSKNLLENSVVGVALSYANSDVDSKNTNSSQTDINTYQILFYGDHDIDDQIFMTGALGYASSQNTSRRFNVGGVSGLTATGKFDSTQYVAQAGLGKRHNLDKSLTITSQILTNYVHYKPDSYTETGAGGANLSVSGESLDLFEVGASIQAQWDIERDDNAVFQPKINLEYRYDLIGDSVETNARFTGGGNTFRTEGFKPAQGTLNVGLGIGYQTNQKWNFVASYDYESKSDFQSHNAYLRASYDF